MVIGIACYTFELNMDEKGEISPRFRLLREQFTEKFLEKNKGKDFNTLLSFGELIKVYYNLTTGKTDEQKKDKSAVNRYLGKLKGTSYKAIATFRHTKDDDSQYLIIALFNMDDDIEIFEDIMVILTGRMDSSFHMIGHSDLRRSQTWDDIYFVMDTNLKYGIYQIERLESLTKLQRVALIYFSPERYHALQILRQGPISRQSLFSQLQKNTEDLNLDVVLRPFLELGIVRRDWIKAKKNPRVEITQGEYFFLTKDVYLARKPAEDVIAQMKQNEEFGPEYLRKTREYFDSYRPETEIAKDGKILASFLLNPDYFDLISLMSKNYYLKTKMPKVISPFSKPEEVVNTLLDAQILTTSKHEKKGEMLCLLCDVFAMSVFPEYLMEIVQERYFASIPLSKPGVSASQPSPLIQNAIQSSTSNQNITPEIVPSTPDTVIESSSSPLTPTSSVVSPSILAASVPSKLLGYLPPPIDKELARRALDFLDASYYENLEF